MSSGLHCEFCAFHCRLAPGEMGRCGVRANDGNRIISLVRDKPVALAIDPMEKKPFYHALPGSQSLSIALFGCNFACRFCQNAAISQPGFFPGRSLETMSPQDFAQRFRQSGLPSVSFTYSEPTVWLDWLIEAATAIKQEGGRCFMISNGFFSVQARDRLIGLIDGFNIDLKGNDDFYRTWCGGLQAPVLANIQVLAVLPDVCVEVCSLLIEGIHTVPEILILGEQLSAMGVQVWHLSRFFPAWQMQDRRATSEKFLAEVLTAVRSRIDIPHVYPGNSSLVQDTHCPSCNCLLIERSTGGIPVLFHTVPVGLPARPGCPRCNQPLYLLR